MEQATELAYYKRDFWSQENLKYVEPHFRLEKSSHLANRIARGRTCDLLDVGCGPGTLRYLLHKNISYYGIDIAIHEPAPCFIQTDFLQAPIAFRNRQFDIVLAQGVFEYAGKLQAEKFAEIRSILKTRGRFIVSYVNFDHVNIFRYPVYNNMQSFEDFKKSLRQSFNIERIIPTSHHWRHNEPTHRVLKALQMHMNLNVPYISPRFAIEYFLIASPRAAGSNSRL